LATKSSKVQWLSMRTLVELFLYFSNLHFQNLG
jgi:hypothetical protein